MNLISENIVDKETFNSFNEYFLKDLADSVQNLTKILASMNMVVPQDNLSFHW